MWGTGQRNFCPISSTVSLKLRSWVKIGMVVDSSRRWFPVTTVPPRFASPCSLLSLAEPPLVTLWAKIPRSVSGWLYKRISLPLPTRSVCPAAESIADSNSFRNTIYHCYIGITLLQIFASWWTYMIQQFFWVCPPKKSKTGLEECLPARVYSIYSGWLVYVVWCGVCICACGVQM